LYTVQGTDMGETSPPESSGWAGRVSDGAMHTAGPAHPELSGGEVSPMSVPWTVYKPIYATQANES